VSERLTALSRELVALAAEIEIAKTLLERASQASRARD
jgi:predicted mannosyl-3-phosphoglycerate phosphatase (HAD superfamily)